MAVVQISRIQHRRGQKNTGSGLPQLASAEIGWAIDTQEMYIGNGAVSEGAPAVGNTKILTEQDDLFSIADTYTYRQSDGFVNTGTDSSSPITRTLQERLDDRVSVRAFGAIGDGIVDDTQSIQRAIDQLYLNSATKTNPSSRVTLHMEPGIYRILNTLYLPPYATIEGAGSDKTIIKQTSSQPAFVTVNSSSAPGSPSNDSSSTLINQAREIYLSGITLECENTVIALRLDSCRDSLFRDVKFKGVWSPGSSIVDTDCAVLLNSLSGAVESSGNSFEHCRFNQFAYAVISNWDIENTQFSRCEFNQLGYGIVFGNIQQLGSSGQTVGPSHTTVENSVFENINRQALWVINGKYNTSVSNRFFLIGNDNGIETEPVYPVIQYHTQTNKSFNDYFARTQALIAGSNLNQVPYIPEIEGTAQYSLNYENSISFGRQNDIRLFRLPGVQNQSYELDYTIVSNSYRVIRSGVMTVIIDAVQNNVEVSDNFDFVGDEDFLNDINFSAQLRDADSNGVAETVNMRVTSTMPNDDESIIKFTVKAKKTDTP